MDMVELIGIQAERESASRRGQPHLDVISIGRCRKISLIMYHTSSYSSTGTVLG